MTNPFTPDLLSRLPKTPRKVVLLRASRIGDFLCATPAFRALHSALPEAEITMITLPLLHDLVVRSPYLDRFVAFPGFPGVAEQLFDARRTLQFFQQMQAEQFDLAIQMQGSGVNSNPFTLLLGARATAGFVRLGDSAGRLDAALPYPQRVHEIECVLTLTTFLGIPSQGEDIEFPLWPQDYTAAEALLKGAEPPLIGLHPSARDATRRWDAHRFAAVGAELQQRDGGTVILLGDAEARDDGKIIAQKLTGPCLNLIDKTSLVTLGGIIARLSVFITNDTGPAHIAYALKTPTVTIFGGGDPALNGPHHNGPFRILAYEVPCRPCGYAACPIGYPCLQGVKVQQVVAEAEQIMRLD